MNINQLLFEGLELAIESKEPNQMQLISGLLIAGANPNDMSFYSSPLKYACNLPKFNVLKALLDYADPNIDETFHTLAFYLEHAGKINKDSKKIVRLYLEHGADINLRNKVDQTPLEVAMPALKSIMEETYQEWINDGSPSLKSEKKVRIKP